MAVYARISSDVGRDVFRRLYGVPNVDAPLKLVIEEVVVSTSRARTGADEEPERSIHPPPCSSTRVPVAAHTTIARPLSALLTTVHEARARLQHRAFVDALTSLLPHASKLVVADVGSLVAAAYGVEAVELVATLAGRWVHTRRPPLIERRRIGSVLRDRVLSIQVDATAITCALVVDPHPTLWAALAVRRPHLPLFEILHREMSSRRPALLATLEQAVRVDDAPRAWIGELTVMTSDDPCACGDCAPECDRTGALK
ncbi:MAG: hypothetical protein ACHREM_04050 [Polyangiales bacterium]